MKISTNRPTVSCYSTAVLFLNLRVAELTNDVHLLITIIVTMIIIVCIVIMMTIIIQMLMITPLHIPRPGSLRTADRSQCCIPPPAASFIKVLF